jgi:beta-galactosidase
MCEYAHAMFNSMGSIGDYNDVFDKYPSLMGGAIWEWEDQGVWNRRDTNRQFIAYGGGFGEVPNDHYFIHKGVVFSDRSPKPHYPEMKRAYQWIGFEAQGLAAGKVKIRNKYAFISLDQFKGSWTLSEDGAVIDKGTIKPLALAPGAEQTLEIPFKRLAPKPGARYYLQISFALASKQLWAKAGYEVATAQFQLPDQAPAPITDIARMAPLKLEDEGGKMSIIGQGFTVVFDKADGTISQLIRDNRNLLVAGGGPQLHLWRAPHRNDDVWAYNDWRRYGLDNLKRSVVSLKASAFGASAIKVESVIKADGQSNVRAGRGATATNTFFSVTHAASYTIYGDGSIFVTNAVDPQGARIPLARLGVRLQLDRQLDHFAFLGRGPMENYSDRKRGSDVGLYSSTVRAQMTPYAKPMECGNHEDVRWAALSGQSIPGLMVQATDSDLQVSALPYTDEVMTPIEYTVDLPLSTNTVLTVSGRTLGVGSNGCGPRPLDQYIVWSGPASFSYVLRLMPAGQKDLPAVGRRGVPAL